MYPIVTYPSDCEYYWDDTIYSSKLNAIYKIAPGAVILRHAIKEHKIGVLSVGDEFAVDNISIQDCLAIVDEYLYINADRRLNLLTGEIEHVNNPKHQKIAANVAAVDFLPMSATGAPVEYKTVAKIDRNDGEYLLSIIEINISYDDLTNWLTTSGRQYTVLDEPQDDCTKKDNWRLVVSRTHILITYPIHDGVVTTYREFHDFIVEAILFADREACRIIVPCLETGEIKYHTLQYDECSDYIDVNVLNTYYFATVRTYRDIVCFNGLEPYYDENREIYYDDICMDSMHMDYQQDGLFEPDVEIPAFDMLRHIKPKNIEPVQTPIAAGNAAIKYNNIAVEEYAPNIFDEIGFRVLFSGEHLYKYEANHEGIILTKLDNGTEYECNISKIYTDDRLFYMRGDIIYTCRGYVNIVTGEVTIAPNETIKPNQCANMLNSFDFSIPDDGSKYIIGQYLATYTEYYKSPVKIEGFRAVVNGNISIYEYAGASKVKIPTRTKPAPRE